MWRSVGLEYTSGVLRYPHTLVMWKGHCPNCTSPLTTSQCKLQEYTAKEIQPYGKLLLLHWSWWTITTGAFLKLSPESFTEATFITNFGSVLDFFCFLSLSTDVSSPSLKYLKRLGLKFVLPLTPLNKVVHYHHLPRLAYLNTMNRFHLFLESNQIQCF